MPYFYVSRCKAPVPFVSTFAVAGVMEAVDLETAKASIEKMLMPAAAKGLDSADAYSVQALDDLPRSDLGAVAWTFVSNE